MITSYLAQIAEPSTSYVWKQKGEMGTEPSLQVRPPTRTVAVKLGMGPGPKLWSEKKFLLFVEIHIGKCPDDCNCHIALFTGPTVHSSAHPADMPICHMSRGHPDR